MSSPQRVSPRQWLTLELPDSGRDCAADLALMLGEFRVLAAVRHSELFGMATYAFVPADEEWRVLGVEDTYAPNANWVLIDQQRFTDALDHRFGTGSTLGGNELSEPGAAVGEPRIEANVWTTTEDSETLAMLAARLGMSFDVMDAGSMGRALRLTATEGHSPAFADGAWAMTDGLAVWQAGEESAAAFVQRKNAHFAVWRAPSLRVDPSRPGQTIDGVPASVLLDDVADDSSEPSQWIARFGLDPERASQLRALFRRGPHPDALRHLTSLLELPSDWLDLLSNTADPESITIIEPRGAREQFADALRVATWEAAPPAGSFRSRRPRVWLAGSAACIAALSTYGGIGLADGRWTALIPLLVALSWAASLWLDGSIRRAFRQRDPAASDE